MSYWFKIGQEVIALRTHSKNIFKKGDILIVRNIKPAPCNCFLFCVDIGHSLAIKRNEVYCSKCGGVSIFEDGIYWLANDNFAPLDSIESLQLSTEMEQAIIEHENK